jgi:hypothetical protein
VNETMPMHAQQITGAVRLYRQASAGERSLDSPVAVRNHFRSIADTSVWYSLSPDDDSERELYGLVGQTVPVRELARRMIVRSSNLATNNLIEVAGAVRVRALMTRLGASGMDVRRCVEDGPAYQAGLNNTTDALGFARVLASLARCELLTRELCDDASDVLAQQEFNDLIPRGLPAGTASRTDRLITGSARRRHRHRRSAHHLVVVVLSAIQPTPRAAARGGSLERAGQRRLAAPPLANRPDGVPQAARTTSGARAH